MPNGPSGSTPNDNQDTSLLRRICKLLNIPVPDLVIIGMFAVLLLVDSFSDAALAAGLGSSVLIIFVHPTSQAAAPRSLLGGHILALLIGSVFSLVLFAPPISSFLTSIAPLRNLALLRQ